MGGIPGIQGIRGILCWLVFASLAFAATFSHEKHAPLKLACTYCHATAKTAERAGFPTSERCATCHTERPKTAEVIKPDKPVWKLPDFVFFGHDKHASVACADCHDAKERPLKMKACVNCHKERKATVVCTSCHELSQ